jgi:hypothetical protein
MVAKESSKGASKEETEAAESKVDAKKVAVKKTVKKTVKKKAAPRKSRAKKPPKEVRLKAFWGVFSQALNPVVLFEHNERKKADVKAEELSKSRKSPHFVQLVKQVIEE